MRLEKEKVRTTKYYSIGFSPYLKKYVLSVVVTWVAWYNRYYEISEEEYLYSKNDIEQLDMLAKECLEAGSSSERFLYADKIEENNMEQNKIMKEIRKRDSMDQSEREIERI